VAAGDEDAAEATSVADTTTAAKAAVSRRISVLLSFCFHFFKLREKRLKDYDGKGLSLRGVI